MGSTAGGHSARLFGLDLLRFLAIALVLVEHGSPYLAPAVHVERLFYVFGYFGVELFFVLSGFLIGTILLNLYEQEQRLGLGLIRDFWVRRWCRTLPLYYLVLALNIAAHELFGSASHGLATYLPFLGFLQNAVTPQPGFFGEAWSLSVEEWFYLSLPLVLLLFDRGLSGSGLSVKSKALLGLAFFFVAIVSLRLTVVGVFDPAWNSGIRKMMPLRLDAILTGVFFSWLSFYYRGLFTKGRYYYLAAGACLIPCACWIYYQDVYSSAAPVFFTKTLYFTMTDVSLALLLPAASHLRLKSPGLVSRAVTHVSLVSYSVYLLHQSVVIRFLALLGSPDSVLSSAFFYGAYLGITLVLSSLLYTYFELPMTSLRERFTKKGQKQAVPLEPVAS
ncbi:acyltransferase [Pontibacter saemangeumensis]|uniref:Acyltransferase n=1 Tax=Pontibacter saemangeumensis TaxID=1084525 RepID=A0ABP8LLQ9_9BACT